MARERQQPCALSLLSTDSVIITVISTTPPTAAAPSPCNGPKGCQSGSLSSSQQSDQRYL